MNIPAPDPEDLARGPESDLAVCAAATPAPWRLDYDGQIVQLTDAGKGYPLDYYADSECIALSIEHDTDAAFIALARTALPAWIRRAVAAEKQLIEVIAKYQAPLKWPNAMPDRRTHHARCWETHHDCAIERIDRLEDAISRAGAAVPCMWQHPEQPECPEPGAEWVEGAWLCERHARAVRGRRAGSLTR